MGRFGCFFKIWTQNKVAVHSIEKSLWFDSGHGYCHSAYLLMCYNIINLFCLDDEKTELMGGMKMVCPCCGAEVKSEEVEALDEEEVVYCAFCASQLFDDTPIESEEFEPRVRINWRLIGKGILIFVSLLLVLSISWYGYNEIAYQRAKPELQSEAMALFSVQVNDLAPYQKAGLSDEEKMIELNHQLPLVSNDTVFELDEANGELCIWFPVELTEDKAAIRQATFYNAAVNFLAFDELEEVDFIFKDEKVEMKRSSFLYRQGIFRPNQITQRDFDKKIRTKLLNDRYLARVINVNAGGVDDVTSMNSHAEVALYLKQVLQMEEVNISNLHVETLVPVLIEMEKVYQQYPILYSKVKYFGETETTNATMSTTAFYQGSEYTAINCDLSVFKQDIGTLQNHYRQTNNDAAGTALAGANWQACGVHELGHALVGIAVRNQHDSLEAAKQDYVDQTTATKLVADAFEDAKPRLDPGITLDEAIRDISVYAYYGDNMNAHLYDTSTVDDADYDNGVYHETIAEAFADVFTNGETANEFSKSIVTELDQYVVE